MIEKVVFFQYGMNFFLSGSAGRVEIKNRRVKEAGSLSFRRKNLEEEDS